MKFTTTSARATFAGVVIAGVSGLMAATASAAPSVQKFGATEQLVDGPMVTAYTVDNLQASTGTIPGYAPQGHLWQADITARSTSGTVTPLIADFNARSAGGQTYRVIDTVPAPDGINPSPLVQGSQAQGKIYFDVTGQPPNGVVYNDGVADVLIWTSEA